MTIEDIAALHEKMHERVDQAVARVRGAKAERTRNQLLEAAVDIMGSKGYTATTVDEIAEKAGVSKGILYYHFKSKSDMASAILDEGIGRFTSEIGAWNSAAISGLDAIRRTAKGLAGLVDEHRQFTRFFVSELWRDDREWRTALHSLEMMMRTLVASQIERGQVDGSFRKDVDPEFIATSFIGMCLSLSLDWVTYHPGLTRDDFSDRLLALICSGIAVPRQEGAAVPVVLDEASPAMPVALDEASPAVPVALDVAAQTAPAVSDVATQAVQVVLDDATGKVSD